MNDVVKAVFFDRDGTINERLINRYVVKWEEFYFLPYTFEALRALKDKGYKTILVTNQRGIAKGIMTEDDLMLIHSKMQRILLQFGCEFDHIFYCPHDIDDKCSCRKPQPGLLERAEEFYVINKESSYIVGDSPSDVEAGRRYGVKTIGIGSAGAYADFSINDLSELISIID